MSSSLTGPTSTTTSSINCSSRSEAAGPQPAGTAIIACGALGGHVREIAARRGWDVQVHTLPSMLHNYAARDRPGGRAARARARPGGPAGRARLRRLRDLLRARPAVRSARAGPAARAALLRRASRAGPDPRGARGRAGDVPADRLPDPQLPLLGAGAARAGPAPGAVAGLLRPLPPGGVARAVARAGTGRAGRGGGSDVRPAADGSWQVGTGGLERELESLLARAAVPGAGR